MVYPPCKDIHWFDSRASIGLVSVPLLAPFCRTIAFLKYMYILDKFPTEVNCLGSLTRQLTSDIVLQQLRALLYTGLSTDSRV